MLSTHSKIIVFTPNWIGDILFVTPGLQAMKKQYPFSHLACIVPPALKDLLKHQSYVDEVIPISDWTLWGKWKLFKYLKTQRWDIGILLHRSKSRARLLKWAKVPNRVGYNTKDRLHLLTQGYPEPNLDQHKMDYLTRLFKDLGIRDLKSHYEYTTVDHTFTLSPPYVVFHPGSNWAPKCWPPQCYAKLGILLSKQYGVQMVITGSKADHDLAQKIQEGMKIQAIDLTGKTTLSELASILSRASLVIAGDTGPMHLACASGARVIALYGPTSPILNGPRGAGNFKVVWESAHLEKLSPNRVLSEISKWNLYDEKNTSHSNG